MAERPVLSRRPWEPCSYRKFDPVPLASGTGSIAKEEMSRSCIWQRQLGGSALLEISSKSDLEVGQKLSAFHLKIAIGGRETTVECAFQGSKVFERGGPYEDLYWIASREAKRDPRIRGAGNLIGFKFEGENYPTSPATVFYDWLYFKALYPHRERLEQREEWVDSLISNLTPSAQSTAKLVLSLHSSLFKSEAFWPKQTRHSRNFKWLMQLATI